MTEKEFAEIASYARALLTGREFDINGLRACPSCGVLGEVRLQTPPDDDQIVRRAYYRCFACDARCPDFADWVPCHWTASGATPFAPLREHWNAWAACAKAETP